MTNARRKFAVGAASFFALAGATVLGASPASAVPAPTTTPSPPPNLTGEIFKGGDGVFGGVLTCNSKGPFSFSTSGTASGPYSGTFTETGSGVEDVHAVGTTSFTATFTIKSSAGTVTGTKTLSGAPGSGCYVDPADFGAFVISSYQAVITAPTGRYSDQGSADTNVFETSGVVHNFSEAFHSSSLQTRPLTPTGTDQCKNGGYQAFPRFKNQGDCVSFVATRGKNDPSS